MIARQTDFLSPTGYETTLFDRFMSTISSEKVKFEQEYWETVKPKTNTERFLRGVFAILSVNADWESNCKAYNNLKSMDWIFDLDSLRKRVLEGGVGLTDMRTKAVWQLLQKFHENNDIFVKKDDESWGAFRDRIMKSCFGLGKAKSSFFVEMMYPNEAQVVCLDVHILRLMNLNASANRHISNKDYENAEKYFLDNCETRGFSPYAVRCVYWNNNQRRKNSRYWSKVFEG